MVFKFKSFLKATASFSVYKYTDKYFFYKKSFRMYVFIYLRFGLRLLKFVTDRTAENGMYQEEFEIETSVCRPSPEFT